MQHNRSIILKWTNVTYSLSTLLTLKLHLFSTCSLLGLYLVSTWSLAFSPHSLLHLYLKKLLQYNFGCTFFDILLSLDPFLFLSFCVLSFCPFLVHLSFRPFVFLSICPSVLLYFWPFVLLYFLICTFVLLAFCNLFLLSFCFFCPSVLLSSCLSVLLFYYPFVFFFKCWFFCPFVLMFFSPFVIYPFLHLSLCAFVKT